MLKKSKFFLFIVLLQGTTVISMEKQIVRWNSLSFNQCKTEAKNLNMQESDFMKLAAIAQLDNVNESRFVELYKKAGEGYEKELKNSEFKRIMNGMSNMLVKGYNFAALDNKQQTMQDYLNPMEPWDSFSTTANLFLGAFYLDNFKINTPLNLKKQKWLEQYKHLLHRYYPGLLKVDDNLIQQMPNYKQFLYEKEYYQGLGTVVLAGVSIAVIFYVIDRLLHQPYDRHDWQPPQ